jgi:hypothetical protein
MGMLDCVKHVRALGIAQADRDMILGNHAATILKKQRQTATAS